MNAQNKPIVILIIVLIALFLCCCLCTVAGGALFLANSSHLKQEATLLPSPTLQTTGQPISKPSTIDSETLTAMDAIEQEVSKLRGLTLQQTLKRDFLTPKELEERVTTEFFKDYTPEKADKDVTTLSLLGLLPKGFDLSAFYKQLYAEQIAGYYDNETKLMVVVAGQHFGGLERSTYAHEFTHALQDAAYDFKNRLGFSDEACEKNSEACAALQALIEGDATYTQMAWMSEYATKKDIQEIQKFYMSFKSPVLDSAPAYMQEDMSFPYNQGNVFVKAIIAKDGPQALDKAFTSQKPLSTEQIMHPSRYPQDIPQKLTLPDLTGKLGQGWQELDRENIGEWYTWLILARGYDKNYRQIDSIASAAAEGWGGDEYLVLSNGTESAFVVKYAWDIEKDAHEAYKAFQTYTQLRFGKQDASDIACKDGYCSSLMMNEDNTFTWIISTSRDALAVLQSSGLR
ncbi:MAG: hypothetical protein VB108_07260 [Anaerolineaceae bacterium]|nr:hypothetical protein [Anaerolineaceae bacterium]